MKKAAILTPYLDVLGGAEVYLLHLGEALSQLGYRVDFFWEDPKVKETILNRFGERFAFVNIQTDWNKLNPCQRLLKTKQYDLFFYDTDGSYFFSLASRSFLSIHVPDKALIPKNDFFSKLKLANWHYLFNSKFTKKFYHFIPKAESAPILYPMAQTSLLEFPVKKKLILSVGRFFSKLHSKRQEVLIKAFIKAMQTSKLISEYRLVLVGNYKEEDKKYLEGLQKLALNYSNIEIITNANYEKLQSLYREAMFYWHAAGYQIDEKKEPERVEHFGTTIVEAMLNYAVPLAYKAGGPKEIITSTYSGYLYETSHELIKYTLELIRNNHLRKRMALSAHARAEERFGSASFNKVVRELAR
jgi:glycosyltransferase involved in cell wall biosynthesis